MDRCRGTYKKYRRHFLDTFILILLFSSICSPTGAETTKIELSGKLFQLEYDQQKEALISSDCFKSSKKNSCLARKALAASKNLSLTSEQLWGGKNPGSVKCRKLGGAVVIGITKNRDEMSLCRFADNSLIDCGAL